MTDRSFSKDAGIIGCCVLTVLMAVYAQDSVEGWNIIANGKGQVTSMEYENPSTYLKIQKYMRVDLDNQGNPKGGAVKFLNGFDRDMPKQEATWYWENFNGRHSLWSYLYSKGKLIELPSLSTPLPDSYYGKYTRVVTNSNGEYFGTLQKSQAGSDGFQLVIEGASGGPLIFERIVVKLMQQMK